MSTPNKTTQLLATLAALTASITPLAPDLAASEALATVLGQTDEPIAKLADIIAKAQANIDAATSGGNWFADFRKTVDPLLKDSLLAQIDGFIKAGTDSVVTANQLIGEAQDVIADLQAVKDELTSQTGSLAAAIAA